MTMLSSDTPPRWTYFRSFIFMKTMKNKGALKPDKSVRVVNPKLPTLTSFHTDAGLHFGQEDDQNYPDDEPFLPYGCQEAHVSAPGVLWITPPRCASHLQDRSFSPPRGNSPVTKPEQRVRGDTSGHVTHHSPYRWKVKRSAFLQLHTVILVNALHGKYKRQKRKNKEEGV